MRNKVQWGLALVFAGLVGLPGGAAARSGPGTFGDVEVLATVPTPPGSPEGIAVHNGRVYVAGPAKSGTLLSGQRSSVVAFDRQTGALAATYATQGEDLAREHANSCIAFDGNDRLYVLNTQLGLYRIDPATGVQQAYSAPFPNLPACSLLQKAPCSPTLIDLPALPNDIAFAANGDAYVTDSFQATIWWVPAGGGQPQIWFQDARFASPYIGVNGLRFDPARSKIYVSVTLDMLGGSYLYTLPAVSKPVTADLKVFRKFALGDAIDGFAFGATGKLYVTLALPTTSGIAILWPDGSEDTRLVNALLSPTVPYDSPANVAFDGTGSLLVSNHAFATNLPSHFTVLDVFVGDTASPLERPNLP